MSANPAASSAAAVAGWIDTAPLAASSPAMFLLTSTAWPMLLLLHHAEEACVEPCGIAAVRLQQQVVLNLFEPAHKLERQLQGAAERHTVAASLSDVTLTVRKRLRPAAEHVLL